MATLVVVCADECGDKLLSAELVSCSAEIVMSHYFFLSSCTASSMAYDVESECSVGVIACAFPRGPLG